MNGHNNPQHPYNFNMLSASPASPSESGEPAATSTPMALHRLLRGRYRWALLFVAILAGAGIALGFESGHKVYRCTAQIRVMPVLPEVLNNNDGERSLGQVYDGFADTQVEMIGSLRVVRGAVNDPAWRALGRPNNDSAAMNLQGNLVTERKLEIISINVDDAMPQGALAGAQSVVHSYQQVYQNDDRESRQQRLTLLEKHQQEMIADLDRNRQRQSAICSVFTPADLQALHDLKFQGVQAMEAPNLTAAFDQTAAANPASALLPDQHFSPYLNEHLDVQMRLMELKASGMGDNHPQVATLRNFLNQTDQLISARAHTAQAPNPSVEQAKDQLGAVSNQLKALDDLKGEETVINQQLSETRQRIYQLHVVDEMSNRVIVISQGDLPLGPFRDTRKTFAAAGGAGGSIAGLGLALCFCLIDRRFRAPSDLAISAWHDPVVAEIPQLSSAAGDNEQIHAASLAMQQMRMLLHARAGKNSQVLAVTSAGPGAGKTSVTLGLGISFASAGARTLIVDMDLTGASLTTRMGAIRRQPLGRLMLLNGLLNERQIAAASAIKKPGRRFGEACVGLGMVTEMDVSRTLEAQPESRVGVMEALAGQPLEECVVQLEIPNLEILPLGGATAEHAGVLSPVALNRMLDEARRHYDVILFDTGPVLGGLEATLVSAAADGTILVVTQGEQRWHTRQAQDLLNSCRASLVGVVFNRVVAFDAARSGSARRSSSPSSLSRSSNPRYPDLSNQNAINESSQRLEHFGPIGQAVASHVPWNAESRS